MKVCLIGPLVGDLCGVPYEFNPQRDASRIDLNHPYRSLSDDSVLTLAVAKAILERRPYGDAIFDLAQRYPLAGFGGMFNQLWVKQRNPRPYNSYGNGAAMRVAPVGWAFNTVEDVLREAEASAACSHNHPKGIAIAQATALAIFLARKGQDKDAIRAALTQRFGFTLGRSLPEIREQAALDGFDETWKSVPLAIDVFLATDSFEECLLQAIALGCDADTQADIACAIAEAYYGVDDRWVTMLRPFLDDTQADILLAFCEKFGVEA